MKKKQRLQQLSWALAFSCLGFALAACGTSARYQMVQSDSSSELSKNAAPGKVLFVLTAADTQVLSDGSKRKTGYFLNEFYEPYLALKEQGYQIVIATPEANQAVVDPESLDTSYWKEHPEHLALAQKAIQELPQMKAPLSLNEVLQGNQEYQGVVIPGGQGVMSDLLDNRQVHQIISRFAQNDRPVGLVCHAPAILTKMKAEENPFKGRLVTSVSGFEEWFIETFVMDAEAQYREIGDKLAKAGLEHEAGFPGSSQAVRDCNLVTSQNPFSGQEFNQLYLAALLDWRDGARCQKKDR